MRHYVIYLNIHAKTLLKSIRYYLYSFILFFVFAFYNIVLLDKTGSIWVNEKTIRLFRIVPQQMTICYAILIEVSMLLYERFFQFYSEFFSIYIKNRKQYFHALVTILIVANIVPYLVGKLLYYIVNYYNTGCWFFPMDWIMIIILEIIILVFFGVALYLLLQKTVLVAIAYFITIYVLQSFHHVMVAIPLYAKVLQGDLYHVHSDVWLGRVFLLIISISLYVLALHKFLKRQHRKMEYYKLTYRYQLVRKGRICSRKKKRN